MRAGDLFLGAPVWCNVSSERRAVIVVGRRRDPRSGRWGYVVADRDTGRVYPSTRKPTSLHKCAHVGYWPGLGMSQEESTCAECETHYNALREHAPAWDTPEAYAAARGIVQSLRDLHDAGPILEGALRRMQGV